MTKKEKYLGKANDYLRELKAQVETLQTQADETKAEVKDAYQEQLRTLRPIREEAQASLKELKGAGEEVWNDLSANVDELLDDLAETAIETVPKDRRDEKGESKSEDG